MKVEIDGREVPAVRVGDWTFEEADRVKALTNLRVGQVLEEHMRGDAAVGLAFAIVGEMRLGHQPDYLRQIAIDRIVVDLSDPVEQEDEASPPAEGGASDGRRAASRSRRRS